MSKYLKMWNNQHSESLIKIRLNTALKQYDFTNIYKHVFESNKFNEYCYILLNIMASNDSHSFNQSGFNFLDNIILEGHFNPLQWLCENYKKYGNSNIMNVINMILISVKQREEKVNETKKILHEQFGDVGRYVVSQYL